MKIIILVFILLIGNNVKACENSRINECNIVQIEINDLSHSQNKCCEEFCLCNCCNQLSILSLISIQNYCVNNSSKINTYSLQNLSDFTAIHWQPPKI